MTKRIMIVIGTRPDAIKLAPVIAALQARPQSFETVICSTDQHDEMLAQALETFDIEPHIRLRVMRPDQSLTDLTARLLPALDGAVTQIKPDRIIVQGDTMTALTGAMIGFYGKIPVAHVEAGLRSHDPLNPFPEETVRRLITAIADIHFAPTQVAADALLLEGIAPDAIHVTGNTVIDALHAVSAKLNSDDGASLVSPAIRRLIDAPTPFILMTCHRRESLGAGLAAICRAIARIAADHPQYRIIFPVHFNPNVQCQVRTLLEHAHNITLIDPVTYPEMVRLLSKSRLVLSDSGGLQEEAPSFGVPLLVLRNATDRPEGVAANVTRLVGTDEDLIVATANQFLSQPHPTREPLLNPFGDGLAASRIVDILERTM
jgi:UDP-N-acetylglucosamine 2-epimerase (non-hydrolysing)